MDGASRFAVRLATAADADVIARHRAGMFRDMGSLRADAFDALVAASRTYLAQAISRGTYRGWLAAPVDRPDNILSGAGVHIRDILPRPDRAGGLMAGPEALVVNVYTDHGWRRLGLAEMLMRHIIEWSETNGIQRMVLHASDAGRSLYMRLGFSPTNEMRYNP